MLFMAAPFILNAEQKPLIPAESESGGFGGPSLHYHLKPGGGYIVSAVHAIQPDVPPENILAMVDATRKYGTYPLTY